MARDAERPSVDAIQRLFELSLDMLGTSSGGYFTELNPAWEQWLGWTREELMAVPFISFVHPDDLEATLARSASLADPEPRRWSRSRTAIARVTGATGPSTGRPSPRTASCTSRRRT